MTLGRRQKEAGTRQEGRAEQGPEERRPRAWGSADLAGDGLAVGAGGLPMGYKDTTARLPWLSRWEEPGLSVSEERGGAGGRWHKIFGAVQNQVAEWASRSVWAGGARWGSPRPSGDERSV